jgi:hypothetical protein
MGTNGTDMATAPVSEARREAVDVSEIVGLKKIEEWMGYTNCKSPRNHW